MKIYRPHVMALVVIALSGSACRAGQNTAAIPLRQDETLKTLDDLHTRYRNSKLTAEQFNVERDRLVSSEEKAFSLGQQMVYYIQNNRQSSQTMLADLLLQSVPQHMQRQIMRGILTQYAQPQLASACDLLLEETPLVLLEQALPTRAENEEKKVEFPLGAVSHLIKVLPDASFDAFAKTMLPENKRVRLWEAQRELMQYTWRRFTFSQKYADDKAGDNVLKCVSELVNSENLLCKLYAAQFLNTHKNFRTPELVKTLQADTNEYVKAAVAAWDKKDAP